MMRLLIKIQKKFQLAGVEADINYIKKFRGALLDYDLDKARKSLSELKNVENPTKKQTKEIDILNGDISKAEATKQEYERMKKLKDDIYDYLSIL